MLRTISEMTQFWGKVLQKIEENINEKQVFDSFFSDSYINEIRGGTLIIVVNSAVAVTLMKNRYVELIKNVVNDLGEDYELDFIQSSEVKSKQDIQQPSNQKSSFFPDSDVDPKLTFDNFVVGEFNKEAQLASLMIASNPGQISNPLFIYSNSGLGKTHLLHAVGNYVSTISKPGAKIIHITANDFVEEYVKYTKGYKDTEVLKDFFKDYDVLLFDDVQFLEKKILTQEMFFYVYEWMYNHNRQIVITSDRQPAELTNLQERLVTRFSKGLIVTIGDPDQTTCVEILKKKIASSGYPTDCFDASVLYFISEKFSSSVRELEGALDRLIFYAFRLKQAERVTMDIAIEAMSNIIGTKSASTQINEQKIINIVSDYYNFTPSQLTGTSRSGQLVIARHVAQYLIYTLLNLSYQKIGDAFGGKDHTTVSYAIAKVENELKTDEALKQSIEELQKRLKI